MSTTNAEKVDKKASRLTSKSKSERSVVSAPVPANSDEDDTPVLKSQVAKKKTRKCGKHPDPSNLVDLESIPRTDILALRTRTVVDDYRDRFPLPKEAIPPFGLRRWVSLPLSHNVGPLSPGGTPADLSFSRGRLGCPLLSRRTPKFTTHEERVLRSPYSSLHDPGCLNYFVEPEVFALLLKKGFITTSGQVLCSFKEIQQFYEYMESVSNSFINDVLEHETFRWNYEKEQKKMLIKERGKEQEDETMMKKQRFMAMGLILPERPKSAPPSTNPTKESEIEQLRILALKKKAEWEQIRRMEKSLERDMKIQLVAAKTKAQEYDKKRQLLLSLTLKDVAAFLKRLNDAEVLKERKEERNLQWMACKIQSAMERADREQKVCEALIEDRKNKAQQRQERLDRFREEYSKWVKKQKNSKQTIWELVKKYFYIWLNKTRARIAQRKNVDPHHQSSFIGQQGKRDPVAQVVMDLSYLKKQGFTDFIMNIMKIRKSVQNLGSVASLDTFLSTESLPQLPQTNVPVIKNSSTVTGTG